MIIQQCQKLVYIYLYHVAYTEEILFQIFYKYVYIKTCYDYPNNTHVQKMSRGHREDIQRT